MPQLLRKTNFSVLLLAAITAGTWVVPVVAAQSTAAQSKKPAQKSSGASTTHSAASASAKKSVKTGSSKSSSKKRSKKVKGQAAPTSDRISEIQEALANRGVFNGTPSGRWDDSTVAAMKKFQSSNGLSPTGKLDALALQRLGFGSETAGLGAPTPPPNATANRLLSRAAQREELKNEDQPQ